MDFLDTHMIEPDDEEYYDTADRILRLSDELSEDIVLENISEQLNSKLTDQIDKINYVSLFREKYQGITPDDDYYDKDYMQQSLYKVSSLVEDGLSKRFGIELANDLDYANCDKYLEDIETLYEFLLIRQYSNITDYISNQIKKTKADIVQRYTKVLQDDEHAKEDLFLTQAKKKFKNNDDIIVMHFMNEIIDDICDATTSGFILFDTIVNLDLFEEYNNRMSEILANYGNSIVMNDDAKTAKLYLAPLMNIEEKNSLRNKILIDYRENCEIIDD